MKRKIIIASIFLLAACRTVCGEADIHRLTDILINAHINCRKIPVLSIQYPGIDETAGYLIQKTYVKRLLALSKDRIAGFKAGLTSESAMKRFAVKEPLAGVLFASGETAVNTTIDKTLFRNLMIETEIGFIIEKPIHHTIKDVGELKNYTRYAVPVIELPELGFADMKKLKSPDIIAANIGSKKFILGKKKKIEELDLNAVAVTLKRNGEIINRGKGADAFDGQWKAALWLVNTLVKKAWKIEPGHVLITGALGRMLPAEHGKYIADYGNLGIIDFKIK